LNRKGLPAKLLFVLRQGNPEADRLLALTESLISVSVYRAMKNKKLYHLEGICQVFDCHEPVSKRFSLVKVWWCS
jgi:hypothetical protein